MMYHQVFIINAGEVSKIAMALKMRALGKWNTAENIHTENLGEYLGKMEEFLMEDIHQEISSSLAASLSDACLLHKVEQLSNENLLSFVEVLEFLLNNFVTMTEEECTQIQRKLLAAKMSWIPG